MKWQPIETVPKKKDTPILVTDGEKIAIVWWTEAYEGYSTWSLDMGGEDECLHYGTRFYDENLTHWMPLPELPE